MLGSHEWVSNVASKIGKAAGIVVATHPITKRKKYASLHDLRRTFATWLAMRAPEAFVRKVMRHISVQTTHDYYIDFDVHSMREAWNAIETT